MTRRKQDDFTIPADVSALSHRILVSSLIGALTKAEPIEAAGLVPILRLSPSIASLFESAEQRHRHNRKMRLLKKIINLSHQNKLQKILKKQKKARH